MAHFSGSDRGENLFNPLLMKTGCGPRLEVENGGDPDPLVEMAAVEG